MVMPGSGGGSRKRTTRHLAEALPQPIRSAKRRARSRRATGAPAGAAARQPARATARATRTHTASAAVPGRSRGNGPASGAVRRCAPGERATALPRPPTTGRAPTHAGAAAKRLLVILGVGRGRWSRRPRPPPGEGLERLPQLEGQFETCPSRRGEVPQAATGRSPVVRASQ